MSLGVIPMICFRVLRILGEKSQKSKLEKKTGHIGLLRCSAGNSHRSVDLSLNVGCLAVVRPRGQNGTPWVRHEVAKLRRIIATVHSEQISGFCFRTPRIHTPIV